MNLNKIGIVKDEMDDFELNQEDRLFKVREKAHEIKTRLSEINVQETTNATHAISHKISQLHTEWPALFGDRPQKIYAHIDLDSFYASVETLYKPEYKNIPLGIGSTLMLATSNYEARKYGVRAGMPGYIAKKLCPDLVIVRCDFTKYNYYSDLVMSVLSAYVPSIEIYGIDEACLVFDDRTLSGALNTYNNNKQHGKTSNCPEISPKPLSFEAVVEMVEEIRKAVYRATGLTVSAGISVCRGLAKLACGINKPDGYFVISEKFDEFISKLNIDKLNGIGKATKELLAKSLEITTVSDLRTKLPLIYLLFKEKTFTNIFRLSFGLSLFDSPNLKSRMSAGDKSKGMNYSFLPTSTYDEICDIIWYMSGSVSRRLKRDETLGSVVTVTIKFNNFKSVTKRKKTEKLLEEHIEIFNVVMSIISESYSDSKNGFGRLKIFFDQKIRMLGISVSALVDAKAVNLIQEFKSKPVKYKPRECNLCSMKFINESDFTFESHMNACLNAREKKLKAERQTLHYYLGRKSNT